MFKRHTLVLIFMTATVVLMSFVTGCTDEVTNTPVASITPQLTSPTTGEHLIEFDAVCGGGLTDYLSSGPEEAALSLMERSNIIALQLCSADPNILNSINFDTTYAVGLFRGLQQSGGFGIAAQDVSIRDNILTVVVMLPEVGPETPRVAAVTYPYQLITISKEAAAGISEWQMVTTGGRLLASMAAPM